MTTPTSTKSNLGQAGSKQVVKQTGDELNASRSHSQITYQTEMMYRPYFDQLFLMTEILSVVVIAAIVIMVYLGVRYYQVRPRRKARRAR